MINTYGIKREPAPYIRSEAQVSRIAAKQKGETIEPGGELPTRVVIRCDRNTPFKTLYAVIQLCQDEGFVDFALRAMEREEG